MTMRRSVIVKSIASGGKEGLGVVFSDEMWAVDR